MNKNRNQLILLFLINFFFFMGINSMNILPAFLDNMGSGSGVIALFTTLPILSLVLLVIVQIVRKVSFHKLRSVRIGFILSIISMIALFFFHENIVLMFIFYLGTGFTYGAGFTNLFSMMYDIVPVDKRRSSAALFGISGLMTSGLASVISEYIYTEFSKHYIFAIPLICSMIAFILMMFIHKGTFNVIENKEFNLSRFISSKEVKQLVFLTLVFGGSFGIFKSFLPVITQEKLHEVDISRFFALFTLIGILYRILFARLMDKVKRNLLLIAGFVLMGSSIIGLNFITQLYQLYVLGALYGLAHSLLFPTFSAEFVKNGGEEGSAYNNIFLALFTLGITVNSSILGFVGDAMGLYVIPWTMTAIIFISILVLFFRQHHKDK